MELVLTGIVLVYSLYRTWLQAIFPYVFGTFAFALAYWLRSRVPFFYNNHDILNYFFVLLIMLALLRHAARRWQECLHFDSGEIALLFVLAYSWLSFMWSPGADLALALQAIRIRNTVANEIIFAVLLPLLMKAGLGKLDLRRDFTIVGLTILPIITFTTDWYDRGTEYQFSAIDPETGEFLEEALSPLTLAYFAATLAIFSVTHVRATTRSLLIMGFIFATALYLLLQSQTRGQLFATLLAIVLILPFHIRRFTLRHYVVALPILGAAAVIFVFAIGPVVGAVLQAMGFDDSVLQRFSPDVMGDDLGLRLSRAGQVFDVWRSSLPAVLFGLGTAASFAIAGSYIHMVPLEVIFEEGLFVGALYLFSLGRTFTAIANMLSMLDLSDAERRLAMFFSAQFLVLFIVSFKEGAIYNNYSILAASVFCLTLSGHLRRGREKAHLPFSQEASAV